MRVTSDMIDDLNDALPDDFPSLDDDEAEAIINLVAEFGWVRARENAAQVAFRALSDAHHNDPSRVPKYLAFVVSGMIRGEDFEQAPKRKGTPA